MGESIDLRTYSPLTFAFLGDAVYSLYIRDAVVRKGNMPSHKLHKKTSGIVNARAQAEAMDALMEHLSEEEREIASRGIGAKPEHHAKNASPADYHKATGLEALFGYLYLKGRHERIRELTERCIRIAEGDAADGD
ncbi:MAG: ribonuclease III [Lachnospiraceae bacterium]|nr:ribonuclease III [Lachnospiraceae bacterium]